MDGCLRNLPNVHSASNDPFLKGKTFYFAETFAQQTQHTTVLPLGSFLIEQNFSRVGWLVNDPLRPQTNIYANTSNAAISDPALPGMLQKKGDENRESKRVF